MAELLSYRPNLEVTDVASAVDFLARTFGFTVDVMEGDPPFLAIISHGEVGFGIVQSDNPGVNSTTAGYFGVTDVQKLHDRCVDLGVPVVNGLTDHPWGLRDFVAEIPGGHRLAFGQRISSPS
jgi:predicted enzyme related to lactoylglutathione lyase